MPRPAAGYSTNVTKEQEEQVYKSGDLTRKGLLLFFALSKGQQYSNSISQPVPSAQNGSHRRFRSNVDEGAPFRPAPPRARNVGVWWAQ
jgi:hypothetical protein